jgi:hypothetical protein
MRPMMLGITPPDARDALDPLLHPVKVGPEAEDANRRYRDMDADSMCAHRVGDPPRTVSRGGGSGAPMLETAEAVTDRLLAAP